MNDYRRSTTSSRPVPLSVRTTRYRTCARACRT